MSLDQYNKLMSDMLNEKQVLVKLRTELEGRKGRLCKHCRGFGHLTQKCRRGEKEQKETMVKNRFEVLKSRVIQCGIREVRRQEVVREEVKCFGCGEKKHKKWKCPNRNERKREKVAPPWEVWER